MRFLQSALILILSPRLLCAYRIDSSCKGPEAGKKDESDERLMREAADAAFQMVDEALAAIDRRTKEPSVLRLIELLYCSAHQNPVTRDLSSVIDTLKGLQAVKNEVTPGQTSQNAQEIVSTNRTTASIDKVLQD